MAFSDVYDILRTKADEYFAERKECNDPYDPESGKTDDLDSAWGFLVGAEAVNETFVGAVAIEKSYSREMNLFLSNKLVNGRGVPTARIDKEKKLISDGKAFARWLESELIRCGTINSVKLVS